MANPETVTVLGHVISSEPVEDGCPREMLGKACLADSGYPCLCTVTTGSEFSTVNDSLGHRVLATLSLTTGSPVAVKESIDAIGLVAHFEMTTRSVRATFDLRSPENGTLRDFLTHVLGSRTG